MHEPRYPRFDWLRFAEGRGSALRGLLDCGEIEATDRVMQLRDRAEVGR